MTDEEIIAVVTARMEGKRIEVVSKGKSDWVVADEPCWNFDLCNYRSKPEPHYRPFESAEEVMEAIKEHGDWLMRKNRVRLIEYNDDYVWFGASAEGSPYSKVFGYFSFLDGTPFGKLVEE